MADPLPERPAAPWRCIDSHAHLAMPAFGDDLPAVIERAHAAGITDVLTASTSLEDAPRTLEIASAAGGRIWAAAGIHPHEARRWREGDEERLATLLRHDRVVAVGEAGLDYHYEFSPRDAQRDVLSRQVRLAARSGLPIVIHCRKAAADVAAILESQGASDHGGVIHCFTEDEAFARRCLDLGFYISFSGIVTFRNASALRDVVRMIPEDRLLVETDAPYLAPMPHRGERNEPARAAVVLAALAEIRKSDAATLAVSIRANFGRFIRRALD